jgi:hypothetical protein
MSPIEALEAARTAGIQISVDGDDLVLESAAEPPVAVVDLLTGYKAGILAILRSGQAAGSAAERGAIAEFEVRADHIGAAPLLASTDTTGTASSDITGSASTDMIGSASGDIARSRSGDIAGSADITALQRPQEDGWSSEDWRAFYGEKAAIAEHDGKLAWPQAEGSAYQTCIGEWLDRNPVSSNVDDGCRVCGGGDRPGDDLLPVGLGSGLERTWLHSNCIPIWHSARMAQAASALAVMGVRSPEVGSP